MGLALIAVTVLVGAVTALAWYAQFVGIPRWRLNSTRLVCDCGATFMLGTYRGNPDATALDLHREAAHAREGSPQLWPYALPKSSRTRAIPLRAYTVPEGLPSPPRAARSFSLPSGIKFKVHSGGRS